MNAYLDIFYGFDFNNPKTETRLPYFYHHNRHNEFNVNHGIIDLHIEDEGFRGNLGVHVGTYVRDNYSSEPDIFKAVYNANIGIALSKDRRLWLDAGIFGGSWLGIENTTIWENSNVGHNLMSENVPYYFAGAVGSYVLENGLEFKLIVTNGWQRIRRVTGNSLPSFGTEVQYFPPNKDFKFDWSTFIGTDDPDASRRMRYFNNFYTTLRFNKHWLVTGGFDIGFQQESRGSSSYDDWWGIVVIGQRDLTDKWKTSVRVEYYHDPSQVIVSSLDPQNGFKTTGVSMNFDYSPFDLVKVRMEARYITSPDNIFIEGQSGQVDNSLFLLGALVMNLNRKLN